MQARLIPADGGEPIELVKELTLIGRGADCDLRLDHKGVSKRHCVLVKTDGLVLLRDLGSTNGTRVNGQRVRRGSLLPNDGLTVANFRFTLKFGAEPITDSSSILPDAGLDDDDSDTHHEPLESPPEAVRRNALPDDYPGPTTV